MSCASWETNADLDIITFPTDPADHMNPVACYLGPQGMSSFMTHPYASPIFGSFKGLPPLLIQGGDCEVLRDEQTLLAHKATLEGVHVVHEIYEDAVHVFQLYPFLEQARKAFRACRKFVLETLPAIKAQEREARILAGTLSRRGSTSDWLGHSYSSIPTSSPHHQIPASNSYFSTRPIPEPRVQHQRQGAPVSPPLTPPTMDVPINSHLSEHVIPVSPSNDVPREHEVEQVEEGGDGSSTEEDVEFNDSVESALEREISGAGDGSKGRSE